MAKLSVISSLKIEFGNSEWTMQNFLIVQIDVAFYAAGVGRWVSVYVHGSLPKESMQWIFRISSLADLLL